MAKPHTFPKLYDEARTLSTAFLRDNGYLKPQQWQGGVVTWYRNGEKVASISIAVSTAKPNPYVELDYSYNGNPVKYKVQLIQKPSNLGKGFMWYFICPHTGKRCRKLYLICGYFYHREAFSGCMYEKQTQSKYARMLDKKFGLVFRTDELYSQLRKKYFKSHYAGKPTKKYLKILKQIERSESIDYREIEWLMLV
jgi:hypothetical protein